MTRVVRCSVNGAEVERAVPDRLLLIDLLRQELRLTGTHEGCTYGVCGACTVLVDGLPVRSCLQLAVQVDGRDVRTVEGLDDAGSLREAFAEHHGLQCGFCTPGILCSLAAHLGGDDPVSAESIDDVLSGHLCRCTGYVGIRRAARAAAGLDPDAGSEP